MFCPDCNIIVEKMARKSAFYNFYKCPNCRKTFRKKKETGIPTVEQQLDKILNVLYLLVVIIVIYIIIDLILRFL